MTKDELLDFLKENLTIECDVETKSTYVGNPNELYRDYDEVTISLSVDAHCVSKVTFTTAN